MSISSAEAEYRSIADTNCEVKWRTYIMKDLMVDVQLPIQLNCDSQAALLIARNPVLHKKMKRVELDLHFIRDMVAEGFITTPHISTHLQLAD